MPPEIGVHHDGKPEFRAPSGPKFRLEQVEPHTNARLKEGIQEDLSVMRDALSHGAVRTPKHHHDYLKFVDVDTQKHFERNQVEFLGSGSENVVFELAEFPGEVVKVQARLLTKLIQENVHRGVPPDHTSEKQWTMLRDFARVERQRHAQLVEYFGSAVPSERIFRRQVPVTKAVLEAAERDGAAKALKHHVVYKLWTAVRLQDKLPHVAFNTDTSVTLTTTYTEGKHRYAPGEYEMLNEDLLDGNAAGAEDYLRRYPQMVKLLDQLRSSPELKKLLYNFVSQAVDYTTHTGEILDMAGKSNLRVYFDGQKWRLIMPDPLFPDPKTWAEAEAILWSQARGQQIHGNNLVSVVNAMNYARLINSLAAVCGSSARLRFAYETAQISAPLIKNLSEFDPKFSLNRHYRARPLRPVPSDTQGSVASHDDTWQTGFNQTHAA